MLEWLLNAYELDDDYDGLMGYPAFVSQTLAQKAWTLHKIAFCLLNKETPVFSLTAYSEATLDAVLGNVETLIVSDIECSGNEDDDDPEYWYLLRRAILAVVNIIDPELLVEDDGTPPLTAECSDVERWETAMGYIFSSIMWDKDYADVELEDMPPEVSKEVKNFLGILDDYCTAIPYDPKMDEAVKLINEAQGLCKQVITREEKILRNQGKSDKSNTLFP